MHLRTLQPFLALNALVATCASGQVTYQNYRFEPTRLYSNGATIQLSEFVFSNGGTRLNLVANNPEADPAPVAGQNGTAVNMIPVTVTGGSRPITDAEGALKIIDGGLGTKWLTGINDNGGDAKYLYFDFTAPVTIDSYSFATGGDTATYPNRNPIDWKVWGRNSPEEEWVLVDRITGHPSNPANQIFQQDFPVTGDIAPEISYFDYSFENHPIILNGTAVSLEWDTYDFDLGGYPQGVSMSPSIGQAPLESETRSITPPPNADTVYTLTASNGSRSSSKSLMVRSVAGGTSTRRFYRFTPIATRPGADGHQLSEFSFFHNGTELNLFATNAQTPQATGSTGTNDNLVNVVVTNPGGATPAAESAPMLVDGLTNTKMLDRRVKPVVFEFEQAVTIDSYRFTTANDANLRDPVQWILEGSDDGTNWDLIDNITAFSYPTPTLRFQQSQIFPLPGTSLDTDVAVPVPFDWTGALSTNFDVAFNWSAGSVPGTAEEFTVASGDAIRGGNLERYAETTVSGTGALTVNGRLINRGDLTVEGGTLKVSGNYFLVGGGFPGTIRHSGGVVDATLDRGFFTADDNGASGSKYLLSGTGQLSVKSTGNGNTSLGGSILHNVHIGKGGTNDLFEVSGGQASFTSSNNNFVYISRTGTMRLTGGSASFANYTAFLIGFEGAGDNLLDISGGSMSISGSTPLLVGGGSTGAVALSGGSLSVEQAVSLGQSNANGTFTMTGGSLTAADITSTSRGTFIFHGGEITLAGDRRPILAEAWFDAVEGTTATYDAGLNRTLISVGGSGRPFSEWAAAAGVPEGERGADHDPDRDGVVNLLEFALAGQPGAPGSRGIHVPVPGQGGAVITLAVRQGASFGPEGGRLVALVDGIRYEIQGSTDLGNWDAPVEEVVPALTQGVAPAPSADWELRSFRLAGTAGDTGFLRAAVMEAP
jgi:hypothetical protein